MVATRTQSTRQPRAHLHERIYQYVYDDKWACGTLHRHLRCQKQRHKRYGSYDRRGQLANRRCISERPAVVDSRSRLGDWEADTIVGKGHQQAIVSLTEGFAQKLDSAQKFSRI